MTVRGTILLSYWEITGLLLLLIEITSNFQRRTRPGTVQEVGVERSEPVVIPRCDQNLKDGI